MLQKFVSCGKESEKRNRRFSFDSDWGGEEGKRFKGVFADKRDGGFCYLDGIYGESLPDYASL